ncbi:retinoid-inducible serine carboxypeptidase-like [Nylanderia fulva]|uniref:retinoid-inducible serine carboxypeptidase-like n=1 Tax=Nylanderia fulva TaxID=613905 RepID=UPI0010FBB004|nr:retinoid-inducible serine carboxypeptidase-like [Nylanderia fulva]
MKGLLICIFTILCFVSGSIGRKGFGPGEQEWGYVEVRPDAHMFWWLYYTTADVKSYYEKPLIIWLQGGPGGSSTAYGNFEELGSLDVNLKPRNYTWVKNYNVLFIDNPVGTGFSYVNSSSAFATTNTEIACDLLECIRGFYDKLPKFKSVPTYIITESYGGKMGAEFAFIWAQAQKTGNIESNLQGVALGDAWISPIDCVMTWAQFLLNMGMIDTHDFKDIDTAAKKTKEIIKMGEWKMATKHCGITQQIILNTTYNIDFYNILEKRQFISYDISLYPMWSFVADLFIYGPFIPHQKNLLDNLMNGSVKKTLDLKVRHGHQSVEVINYLKEDFMKPVTNIMELLLNETNLKVFVYNGNLDLVVTTLSTLLWIEKLKWKEADAWKYSIREPIVNKDNVVKGYVKARGNFAMYWVNRAGHMVPKNNPAVMELILQALTSYTKE